MRVDTLPWRIAFHLDDDLQMTPFFDVVSDDTIDVIVSEVTEDHAHLIVASVNASYDAYQLLSRAK